MKWSKLILFQVFKYLTYLSVNEGESIIEPNSQVNLYILVSGHVKLSKYRYEELALEEKEILTG